MVSFILDTLLDTFLDIFFGQIFCALTLTYICSGAAPELWFEGGWNIGQNFINDFRSSPVLQWRRKNFGSGGHSAKNVLIKEF